MPADPKVLGLRRVYQTELSLLLSHFYHELDGTELSREARYSEIVKLLEDAGGRDRQAVADGNPARLGASTD